MMMSSKEIATRQSSTVLPLPEARADLGFAESYTAEEFDRIRRGVIPLEMEDKWLVFYEEPWLYFHRSWTGIGIYGVRLDPSTTGAAAVESWVNRDSDQYKQTDTDYDRAILKFLLDALVLGKHATFPISTAISTALPDGAYQHHMVGRAYPESAFPAVDPPKTSRWRLFRRRSLRRG